MAKFFVGQRVRIVRVETQHDLVGLEAVIVGPKRSGWCWTLGDYIGWPLSVRTKAGNVCVALDEHIEPILPEGHQPSEFKTLRDLLASLEVTA